VQPDVTKVGGISEEQRIGWMAQERGIRFIRMAGIPLLGSPPTSRLASAFAGTELVEYITGSPYVDEIVVGG
jgi:L-alanine-DL-glutamate epimerase-like enolase superfamily enzyme